MRHPDHHPAPAPSAPAPVAWIYRLFWGTTYAAVALFMGTVGLAVTFLDPFEIGSRPAQSAGDDSGQRLRSFLSQGTLPYRLNRPINVVVMGIDRVPEAAPGSPESFASRSDTLLLVRLDPQAETINVLSVPRDTQVEVPGYGLTKINHANWFGGPQLVKDVIAHNFNDLALDRYVRVDTGAFRAVVDAVGGVEVVVPQDMVYEDQTQQLYIDLKAGRQLLNGDQAEQFARFRHDIYGDIGRVQRQQMLLKALQQKLASPQVVTKLPQLLEIVQSHGDTNLTLEEMAALAGFGLQVGTEGVKMVMLPGRASDSQEFAASYWLMEDNARDRLLQDYFAQSPPTVPRNFSTMADLSSPEAWEGTSPEGSQRDGSSSRRPDLLSLHIAVQNASGLPDQGYAMAQYLRELGFWNVYVMEDWAGVADTTQVIAQQGDITAAQNLQRHLGLGAIEASSTGALDSDLTLRLGRDSLGIGGIQREIQPGIQVDQ